MLVAEHWVDWSLVISLRKFVKLIPNHSQAAYGAHAVCSPASADEWCTWHPRCIIQSEERFMSN